VAGFGVKKAGHEKIARNDENEEAGLTIFPADAMRMAEVLEK